MCELESELSRVRDESSAASARALEFEKRVAAADAERINKVRLLQASFKEQIERERSVALERSGECTRLQAEVDDVRGRMGAEIVELREAVATLQVQLANAEVKARSTAAAATHVEPSTTCVTTSSDEVERLESLLAQEKSRVSALSSKLAEVSTSLSVQTESANGLQRDLIASRMQVAEAMTQIASLQAQLRYTGTASVDALPAALTSVTPMKKGKAALSSAGNASFSQDGSLLESMSGHDISIVVAC
ncbi:MAG: hypothetical protein EOO65_06245 [Methanosarcinales archaeon]|nr:MAG: hypothetical protein EOO65_06245 [Methanosarcinales archaeon]